MENASPPAVVPGDLPSAGSADAPSAANAYAAFVRVLRAQGCRCPLMWNGMICVPATVCDQQEPGTADRHVCKVLLSLPPVPASTSSDMRKPPEPPRTVARPATPPLDADVPSAGD